MKNKGENIKLSELTIQELESLYNITQKYADYMAVKYKITQGVNNTYNETISKRYLDSNNKLILILNEINNRITKIVE